MKYRLQPGKLFAFFLLIFAIGFNIWLYRLEPTATTDPNDNTFQYALVDRTNQMWDFSVRTCPKNVSFIMCHVSFLVDHWVPNWAEGYNLPNYYSHVPQIVIVASFRLFSHFSFPVSHFSLFQYYHVIIYLLLCLFPLSLFIALRILKLPWLIVGFGTLFASQISTDGLYGLDPSSFLWRGYGLSSQLFAMIFLPLAVAYSWRYLTDDTQKSIILPVFFLTMTTMGHLGIGIMAILSLLPIAYTEPILLLLMNHPNQTESDNLDIVKRLFASLIKESKRLFFLAVPTVVLLSYWIVPVLLGDNYHNISVWDPVWKFNSYGAKETIIRLLNGDLFDFGRFPAMTLLVIIGLFAALYTKFGAGRCTISSEKKCVPTSAPFGFLFLFWLIFYFGRTTWGGLIDLIPGMKEFHLSRFIVGLHISGLFLIPIGIMWMGESIQYFVASMRQSIRESIRLPWIIGRFAYLLIGLLILPPVYRQTIRYNDLNDKLIVQANSNHEKVASDEQTLFTTLRQLEQTNPGRVYAGRGGNWGKDFRIAETPYYIYLSTFGVPTVLWLPETWSPNSDIEQYFSEDVVSHYELFGIRYVVTPPTVKPQAFWKFLKETPSWKLYEVQTGGYVTSGIRVATISVDKRNYTNLIRLWIQSDKTHVHGLYPELTFDKDYPKKVGMPNFKMKDEADYEVPDGSIHNIFREPPLYLPPGSTVTDTIQPFKKIKIISQKDDTDMIFRARVKVEKECTECMIILRESFHPTWRATIDGKRVVPITVFPFFTAVPVDEGEHKIIFSYSPSRLKMFLLLFTLFVPLALWMIFLFRKKGIDKRIKTRQSSNRS